MECPRLAEGMGQGGDSCGSLGQPAQLRHAFARDAGLDQTVKQLRGLPRLGHRVKRSISIHRPAVRIAHIHLRKRLRQEESV